MFKIFIFISLCIFLILISFNTVYQNSVIGFILGMLIGFVCNMIAKRISPYLFKLKNKNL